MGVVILESPTGKLEVEVADTLFRRVKGLAFRRELPGDGMLFTFPKPCRLGFWMLGMRFAIDLVFLDGEKRVLEVRRCEPISLKAGTWRVYYPQVPVDYVLETRINSGIKEGDILGWNI